MQSLNNMLTRSDSREPQFIKISLVLLIIGCLDIVLKIFRCYLGEYYSLFWIHLLFLISLFYWPQYLSGRFYLPQTSLLSSHFRLFLNSLMKAAYYLLAVSLILLLILSVLRQGISDSVIFLPLLFFWPVYVFFQVRPYIKQALLPFSISMMTLLAIQFTNPANPSLETFNNYVNDFEVIVSRVQSGEIKPENNQGLLEIELPCQYRHLVGCPNRKARIEKEGNTTLIYFCNKIRLGGSGREEFVYRSDGKNISVNSSDQSKHLEVRQLTDRWFWKAELF
jgi:hypothetical protein